jgi:hypothetical protein
VAVGSGKGGAGCSRRHDLAEERDRFWPSYDHPNARFAIEARTWWIATLISFRELALVGFPRKGEVSVKQLDEWIDEALRELAAKLGDLGQPRR